MFTSRKAVGQVDAHFSQYYAYPLWLNPGLTGVMDGELRIAANYRRQWTGIADPYSTAAFSVDGRPFDHLSIGATVLDQSAGDVGYNYLNALASAAYQLVLDGSQMNILSVGIQAGVIGHRFDQSKLQSGSQWNPVVGYDPGIPSGEAFDKTSSLGLDANVGIFYYNVSQYSLLNPFMGVSLYHLSRPSDYFLNNSTGRLPMRVNVHGGVKMTMNSRFSLTPQVLYMRQGNAYETAGTLYAQYSLGDNSDFLFGSTYRYKDAIIPFAGMHIGEFTWGISYDANVSRSEGASMDRGGLELSLSYVKRKDKSMTQLTCPRF
jgi:type IX secretion system PorP/SprF family membrane protein